VNAKGTYALVMNLQKNTGIQIGKLGFFEFEKGYYAYVGSAFGPGGLAARIRHHRGVSKHPHWHIDYFRRHASLVDVWVCASEIRYEHTWARRLEDSASTLCIAKGFGSSDCGCTTHFFYLRRKPGQNSIQKHFPEAAGYFSV
jgi:Uri superfamily endonuclease